MFDVGQLYPNIGHGWQQEASCELKTLKSDLADDHFVCSTGQGWDNLDLITIKIYPGKYAAYILFEGFCKIWTLQIN